MDFARIVSGVVATRATGEAVAASSIAATRRGEVSLTARGEAGEWACVLASTATLVFPAMSGKPAGHTTVTTTSNSRVNRKYCRMKRPKVTVSLAHAYPLVNREVYAPTRSLPTLGRKSPLIRCLTVFAPW